MIDQKLQKSRLGAAIFAAVVATVLIMPLERRHSPPSGFSVFAMGLVPAFLAWLVVRGSAARQAFVVFRGVMLAIAFVGMGGLILHFFAAQTPPWVEEAVDSPGFTTWATAYLAMGLFGALAALILQQIDA